MILLAEPREPDEDDEEEQQRNRKILEVWQHCSERSKSVEVLYDNLDGDKILSKVHFRYDPDVSHFEYSKYNIILMRYKARAQLQQLAQHIYSTVTCGNTCILEYICIVTI